MTRDELQRYIFDHYSTEPDYPWPGAPNHAVFRHGGNRKWFALVLDVPRNKLGLPGTQMIDVVNLKCDPILIGSLRGEPGIFPAYHMNKDRWLSVALDGSAADDQLRLLLERSYAATLPKAAMIPQIHRKRAAGAAIGRPCCAFCDMLRLARCSCLLRFPSPGLPACPSGCGACAFCRAAG